MLFRSYENIVIEETDVTNLEIKTFYLIRTYISLAEWAKAEEALKKHLSTIKCEQDEKDKFEKVVKIFIEFIKTGVRININIRNMMKIL